MNVHVHVSFSCLKGTLYYMHVREIAQQFKHDINLHVYVNSNINVHVLDQSVAQVTHTYGGGGGGF